MVIAVFAEEEKWGKELLAGARSLAKGLQGSKVIFLNIGPDGGRKDTAAMLSAGADEVVEVCLNLKAFKAEEYTDAIAAALANLPLKLLLVPATKNGRDVAARIAQRLKVGCSTDTVALRATDGTLEVDRAVLGGSALATLRFAKLPAIATVPSGVFEPTEGHKGHGSRTLSASVDARNATITAVTAASSGGVRLEDARTVVAAGRGIKKKEDLKLCDDLAAAVGGEVGCTRPLSADLKWLSDAHWIGLSGKRVRPKLYFAVGVSGQIQHVAGMRDSGTIVTINKDPDCPMFSNTDYGLVGDLYEIVPALITAIKAADALRFRGVVCSWCWWFMSGVS